MQLRQLQGLAVFLAAIAVAVPASARDDNLAKVHPSGTTIPSNLLRISLHFTARQTEPVLPRLQLRRADGSWVAQPFLDQELWSPSGEILTVLLHPARVKTGLVAHEAEGPVLISGESIALILDNQTIKHWIVGVPDQKGPEPSAWHLSPIQAGTKDVLAAKLDAPIDARNVDYLAVVDHRGQKVPGHATLVDAETLWKFKPKSPWQHSQPYQLVVFSQLEDAAGNRVGTQFEAVAVLPVRKDITLPLTVIKPPRVAR